MIDLGPYAGTVLAAYAAAVAPIGLLVLLSWRRSVRTRAALAEAEAASTNRRRDHVAA